MLTHIGTHAHTLHSGEEEQLSREREREREGIHKSTNKHVLLCVNVVVVVVSVLGYYLSMPNPTIPQLTAQLTDTNEEGKKRSARRVV